MTIANTANMEWMQNISNNHADSGMVKATEIIFRNISSSCCYQTHGPNYCLFGLRSLLKATHALTYIIALN